MKIIMFSYCMVYNSVREIWCKVDIRVTNYKGLLLKEICQDFYNGKMFLIFKQKINKLAKISKLFWYIGNTFQNYEHFNLSFLKAF